jgi:CRISPR-associated protein Csx17
MPARLAADDIDAALRLAWQRLRMLGKRLPGRGPPSAPRRGDGPRLLAALVIPLASREMVRLLADLDLESDEEPTAPLANLA